VALLEAPITEDQLQRRHLHSFWRQLPGVDVTVKVASHFSKVPSIGTEAFTANLIVLFTGVTLKTGTSVGAYARIRGRSNTRPPIQSRTTCNARLLLEAFI